MTWFDRDPRRLALESLAMQQKTRATLTRVGDELTWIEDLRSSASGRVFRLAISYPERFPYAPPQAFILRPSIGNAPHRLINGALCLFDNPHVAAGLKTTALLVRTRAVVWFLAFEVWSATGQWEAPQH